MKTELTVIERAAVALGASECEKQLVALVAASKEITVITNGAGREECHASAMKAVKARTGIAGIGKAVREDSTAFAKAVIAEENRLIALIEPEELRLKALRDEWDAKIEAEKAEKARIEAQRQEHIQALIDAIRNAPALCVMMTAEGAKAALDTLAEMDLSANAFAERRDEAEYIMGKSIQQLESMIAGKQAQEQLAAQMEAQRIENERVAAELAAKQAEAEATQRAALKAEAERQRAQAEELAKQRAEIEAMRKHLADQQAEYDRKAKDEADALIASERAKIEEEARIRQEHAFSEEKRIKEETEMKCRRFAEDEAARIASEQAATRDAEAVAIEERRRIAQCREQELPSATVAQISQAETVTIPKSEYSQLCEDSHILNCLRNAGVDNWEWFDDAMAEYYKEIA